MLGGRQSPRSSIPRLRWPFVIAVAFTLAVLCLEWKHPGSFLTATTCMVAALLVGYSRNWGAAVLSPVRPGPVARRPELDPALRALADASPVGLCVIEGENLRYVNPVFATSFGYASPAEIVDRIPITELIAPRDCERFGDSVRSGTSRAKFDTHHRVAGLRRDGTTVDIEVHVRRCVHQGKPAVSAVLLGITDRNRAEAALIAGNAADDAFHTLVEQTLVGIYIIEGERFRYVNPVFAKLFGYDSPEDIIDRISVVELVAAEDREQVVANVRSRTLAAGTGVRYSFAGLRRDGTTMEVEVHGRSFMHQGKPAVIGALIDITERKRAEAALIAAKVAEGTNAGLVCEIAARKRVEEELVERTLALEQANARLEALSVTDPLTGLANRRGLAAVFDAEWARGTQLAVVMLDIDRFKLYNDRYGHLAGDACLRKVAAALSASARTNADLVARYGGEEFAIILPATDCAGALVVAERVRAAVAALAEPHLDMPLGIVTVSVGVGAATPTPDSSIAQLLARADAALYAAKRAGRNQVVGSPEAA
jgi:diguanylate cyclase (GGDEF)-like protein/PAS domain S-box-containing protein